jgi:hypothetical protein
MGYMGRAALFTFTLAATAAPVTAAQFGYGRNDTTFTVRHTNWDERRQDGECMLRVRIDDEADVVLRGDQVRIAIVKGGPGRDNGSECNAPLPNGPVRNFDFDKTEGRGEARLVEEPSARNGYAAVIRVRDNKGGDDEYKFRLRWSADASSLARGDDWERRRNLGLGRGRTGGEGSGFDPNSSTVPAWLIGRWDGRNRLDGSRMQVEVFSDGRAVGTTGGRETQGSFRDNRLYFGNSVWEVKQTSNGMQMVLSSNRSNVAEFRKR